MSETSIYFLLKSYVTFIFSSNHVVCSVVIYITNTDGLSCSCVFPSVNTVK